MGIDVQLLDEIHTAILALYQPLPGSGASAVQVEARQVFAQAVEASLYKATNQLLDDLHGNCNLLGTPERCAARMLAACWVASQEPSPEY